jgi:hypothetical protein
MYLFVCSSDYWNGLGIFFDTYNNDNSGQNPLVVAVFNDGSQSYDAGRDGTNQALGMCHAPYLRNRNQNSFARVTYLNSNLKVEIAFDSKRNGEPNYQSCIETRVVLGMDKFFGFSAQTGQPIVTHPPTSPISDNHDLVSVTTFDLTPLDTAQVCRVECGERKGRGVFCAGVGSYFS